MTTLHYIKTNGFDLVASVDHEEKTVRILTENDEFPRIKDDESAAQFLNAIEDDSSWEETDYEDFVNECLNANEPDQPKIIATKVKTIWSLEHEGNNYADDCFNGTYDECIAYAKQLELEPEQYQIALIELDDEGIVTYTHEIIKGIEI